MNIDLEIDTKNKIEWLINFVYNTVSIRYAYTISSDGNITKYYNRKNMWHDKPIRKSDNICCGYTECDFDDFKIINSDIYYEFIYDPNNYDDNNDENANYELNASEFDLLITNDMDSINLLITKTIFIKNLSEFNKDHKGSDHTIVKMDFKPLVTLMPIENKITFRDFVIACFDIKSHKFDFWYESYGGIQKFNITDDSIHIGVNFGHRF